MAATEAASKAAVVNELCRKLITGSHILHYHNVLGSHGTLSCRHPFDHSLFLMAKDGSASPCALATVHDMVSYSTETGEPHDGSESKVNSSDSSGSSPRLSSSSGYPAKTSGFPTKPPPAERFIHSAIYKAYPDTHAVVHGHADVVVPYTINGVPLRPCYHLAAFLGHWAPVFDISTAYQHGEPRTMLVSSQRLGDTFARCFQYGQCVALVRGNGFTAIGSGIEEVVFRAVYTARNAVIQTSALTAQGAYGRHDGGAQPIRFLTPEEATAAMDTMTTKAMVMGPWREWVNEVEQSRLYINLAQSS